MDSSRQDAHIHVEIADSVCEYITWVDQNHESFKTIFNKTITEAIKAYYQIYNKIPGVAQSKLDLIFQAGNSKCDSLLQLLQLANDKRVLTLKSQIILKLAKLAKEDWQLNNGLTLDDFLNDEQIKSVIPLLNKRLFRSEIVISVCDYVALVDQKPEDFAINFQQQIKSAIEACQKTQKEIPKNVQAKLNLLLQQNNSKSDALYQFLELPLDKQQQLLILKSQIILSLAKLTKKEWQSLGNLSIDEFLRFKGELDEIIPRLCKELKRASDNTSTHYEIAGAISSWMVDMRTDHTNAAFRIEKRKSLLEERILFKEAIDEARKAFCTTYKMAEPSKDFQTSLTPLLTVDDCKIKPLLQFLTKNKGNNKFLDLKGHVIASLARHAKKGWTTITIEEIPHYLSFIKDLTKTINHLIEFLQQINVNDEKLQFVLIPERLLTTIFDKVNFALDSKQLAENLKNAASDWAECSKQRKKRDADSRQGKANTKIQPMLSAKDLSARQKALLNFLAGKGNTHEDSLKKFVVLALVQLAATTEEMNEIALYFKYESYVAAIVASLKEKLNKSLQPHKAMDSFTKSLTHNSRLFGISSNTNKENRVNQSNQQQPTSTASSSSSSEEGEQSYFENQSRRGSLWNSPDYNVTKLVDETNKIKKEICDAVIFYLHQPDENSNQFVEISLDDDNTHNGQKTVFQKKLETITQLFNSSDAGKKKFSVQAAIPVVNISVAITSHESVKTVDSNVLNQRLNGLYTSNQDNRVTEFHEFLKSLKGKVDPLVKLVIEEFAVLGKVAMVGKNNKQNQLWQISNDKVRSFFENDQNMMDLVQALLKQLDEIVNDHNNNNISTICNTPRAFQYA